MKHTIEFDEKCTSCDGTGVYSGMAEGKNVAIVCHTCKGTGCAHVKIKYEDFEKRIVRKDIKHIYEVNPGICIGEGDGYKFSDFGGMPYEDWLAGKKFKIGMENRKFTCPAWWYQTANYKKKPVWNKCPMSGCFSDCKHFSKKDLCWKRWDKENNEKAKMSKM